MASDMLLHLSVYVHRFVYMYVYKPMEIGPKTLLERKFTYN